jgi:two-component system NarL family sensor kinase
VAASIADLREALVALHPVTLEQGGLDQAMGAIARQAERQGGFTVDVNLDPDALHSHEQLVLAVARELLRNAVQHSEATAVTVRLSAADGEVVLEVGDDGRGMDGWRARDALAAGHIGLASVAQRVAAAGGRFELDSAPGTGTRARATLPD